MIKVLAGEVDLRKKKAVVSMNKEIADEQIIAAVEKAGYTVTEIK